jgi:hypothetical protein
MLRANGPNSKLHLRPSVSIFRDMLTSYDTTSSLLITILY